MSDINFAALGRSEVSQDMSVLVLGGTTYNTVQCVLEQLIKLLSMLALGVFLP